MTFLSYGLLATVLVMVAVQNLHMLVGLVAVQALLLSIQSAIGAVQDGDPALWWAAGLTLVIKGIIIPLLLRYLIRRISVVRSSIDGQFTVKVELLIAITLTFLGNYATSAVAPAVGAEAESLGAALTLVLIGLFLMVCRKLALTQVMGLLVMENGLFLAALATAHGLPLLVDVGILFDVLVSAVVMGILVFRINATFESIDTSKLRGLQE